MKTHGLRPLSLLVFCVLITLLSFLTGCSGTRSASCSTADESTWLSDIAAGGVDRLHGTPALSNCQNLQWQRYRIMKAQLSTDSLLMLTEHPSPALRCYAFFALYERGYKELKTILLNHLHDTTRVQVCLGECAPLAGMEMVGDVLWKAPFFCDTLCRSYPLADLSNSDILSKQERESIDSLFLFSNDITLHIRKKILVGINAKENYYQRIRSEANTHYNEAAMIPLATYRRKEDAALLLALLQRPDTTCQPPNAPRPEDAISTRVIAFARAARIFPDTSFYSALRGFAFLAEQVRNTLDSPPPTENVKRATFTPCPPTALLNQRCTELHIAVIQALAQYRTPAAKALLEDLISLRREVAGSGFRFTTMGILWLKWQKSPDPYFVGILKRIENNYQFSQYRARWEAMDDMP